MQAADMPASRRLQAPGMARRVEGVRGVRSARARASGGGAEDATMPLRAASAAPCRAPPRAEAPPCARTPSRHTHATPYVVRWLLLRGAPLRAATRHTHAPSVAPCRALLFMRVMICRRATRAKCARAPPRRARYAARHAVLRQRAKHTRVHATPRHTRCLPRWRGSGAHMRDTLCCAYADAATPYAIRHASERHTLAASRHTMPLCRRASARAAKINSADDTRLYATPPMRCCHAVLTMRAAIIPTTNHV